MVVAQPARHPRRPPRSPLRPSPLARRIPFTLDVVAVMLAAAGSDRSPLVAAARVGPGGPTWPTACPRSRPALVDARSPARSSPWSRCSTSRSRGGFLVLVGFAELRLGTRRAVLVTVLPAARRRAGDDRSCSGSRSGHGWPWADRTSRVLDVGFSAGALGAAAAATATLRHPVAGPAAGRPPGLRRGVLRLHRRALGPRAPARRRRSGSPLGPRLVGRRIDLRARSLSRHEYRLLASGAFVVSAAAACASSLSSHGRPADGRAGRHGRRSLTSGFVFVVIWLLVANGLRSGRRRAWRWAVGAHGGEPRRPRRGRRRPGGRRTPRLAAGDLHRAC